MRSIRLGISGLLRSMRPGITSERLHERRETQSRSGAAACPGEGEPGEEPGEVQEVLPEPDGEGEGR